MVQVQHHGPTGARSKLRRRGRSAGNAGRPAPRPFRPEWLALEDRRLLSLFTVTDPGDTLTGGAPTSGTLRWAFDQASASASPSTIVFNLGTASPSQITLAQGPLVDRAASRPIRVVGPGASLLSISGNGRSRVVSAYSDLTLVGLTITGGSADTGAGVFAQGAALTMVRCTVSGNAATGNGGGLAISGAAAQLIGCTVSGNSGNYGAGIHQQSGSLSLTGSLVSGNTAAGQGGGIYGNGAPLTLVATTISDNRADSGGGLYQFRGSLTATGATISGNAAVSRAGGMGGIFSPLDLTNCTIDNNRANSGGGILNIYGAAALTGCTITGNSDRSFGGGLAFGGIALTLTGCTITGNSSDYGAGGMTVGGSFLTMLATTVSGNTSNLGAGGIYLGSTRTAISGATISGNAGYRGGLDIAVSTVTISGSLIADNQALDTYNGRTYGRGGGVAARYSTLALSDCTITGNSAAERGGGISTTNADLTLVNSRVNGNTSAGAGGGVVAVGYGTLALTGCDVSGNSAATGGGGIQSTPDDFGGSYSPTISLTDCTVAGNSASNGAGIDLTVGQLTVTNSVISVISVISGNTASIPRGSASGGGVRVGAGTSALISGSELNDNSANDGGAIASEGTLTLQGCTLSGNTAVYKTFSGPNSTAYILASGGGLSITGGKATVSDSTFTSNSAILGGAIAADPTRGSAELTVERSTKTGNKALSNSSVQFFAGKGGAVFLGGYASLVTATLTDCTITGNSTQGFGLGGGIAVDSRSSVLSGAPAQLSLVDCDVSGNAAVGEGGGIANFAGSLEMTGGTVSGNHSDRDGGGIFARGRVSLSGTTLSGNTATGNGGGLAADAFSPYGRLDNTGVTLDGCTVSGNNAGGSGGGVDVRGNVMTLTGCTISGNSAAGPGGGVSARDFVNSSYDFYTYTSEFTTIRSDLTLANCTVSGNSTRGDGGGIANAGANVSLVGCTVSGNVACGSGGGAHNGDFVYVNYYVYYNGQTTIRYGSSQGTMSLANCTVAGNSARSGGGIASLDNALTATNATIARNLASSDAGGVLIEGTATINNTIIAANTRPGGASDVGGTGTAAGSNNLIGTGGSGGLANGVDGNIVGVANPRLGPLGFYGGPTQTIPLLPGSPAIDAGDNALAVGPDGQPLATDQRGLARVAHGRVDVGAFETSGFTLTLVPASQSAAVNTAFGSPLQVVVAPLHAGDPVAGGVLTLTAPSSGASARLSASTLTIRADGTASATATANGQAGSYVVAVSAPGASITSPSGQAGFALTNTPAVAPGASAVRFTVPGTTPARPVPPAQPPRAAGRAAEPNASPAAAATDLAIDRDALLGTLIPGLTPDFLADLLEAGPGNPPGPAARPRLGTTIPPLP